MSRTYRRKNKTDDYYWVLRDTVYEDDTDVDWSVFETVVPGMYGYMFLKRTGPDSWKYICRYDCKYKKDSKEGKKRLAQYHSDSIGYAYNRTGPSWWKTLYVQKPYRQRARQELIKFLRDDEYEYIIESKPKRTYWD